MKRLSQTFDQTVLELVHLLNPENGRRTGGFVISVQWQLYAVFWVAKLTYSSYMGTHAAFQLYWENPTSQLVKSSRSSSQAGFPTIKLGATPTCPSYDL